MKYQEKEELAVHNNNNNNDSKSPYDCSGKNPSLTETKEEKIERISRKLLGLLEESAKKDIDD